jgi:hypothetical protein
LPSSPPFDALWHLVLPINVFFIFASPLRY